MTLTQLALLLFIIGASIQLGLMLRAIYRAEEQLQQLMRMFEKLLKEHGK